MPFNDGPKRPRGRPRKHYTTSTVAETKKESDRWRHEQQMQDRQLQRPAEFVPDEPPFLIDVPREAPHTYSPRKSADTPIPQVGGDLQSDEAPNSQANHQPLTLLPTVEDAVAMGAQFHEPEVELDNAQEIDMQAQLALGPADNEWLQSVADPNLPECPVPSDVLEARRERINNDIISFSQTSRDRFSDDGPSIKGMGTYTHIKLPSQPPQFPHQQFYSPPSEFLPLGGFKYSKDIERTIGQELLQGPIKDAYGKLREVMEEEEQLDWKAFSPSTRFHALLAPDLKTLLQQTSQVDGDTAMNDMNEASDAVNSEAGLNNKSKRPSVFNSGQRPPWGSQRSYSYPGGNVVMGGTTATRTTSGSTYDASRDPRRIGR